MIEYSQSQNSDTSGGVDISFKVIGVGGSGANVLDRLALEGSDDAQLLVLNTDIRKLSSSVSSQKVQLGATLLKGMGTGGDPDLGKQAAIEASDDIREAIRGYDMVFVCVGLGGGTGSGAAPEVCRIAREEGVFLVAFTTLPFEFEGARRMEQARDSLNEIEGYANAVITFDNDRMGELIVPKDGVTQAFAAADKIISQSIRATMNIVSKPGIIRIGMDDLLTALNSTNSRCLFGYGQAKGDNRALDAVDQTLKCPLLDNGRLLNDAKNVLIQVSGSDSMTLLEVQTVMKEMTGHLKSDAHVLFGTGTDPRLGSSLAVTVISSLDGEEAQSGVSAVEKEEVPVSAPEAIEPSPLAAAVTAAAAAAAGEASGIIASEGQEDFEEEFEEEVPAVAEESNIVPMAQPTEPEPVIEEAPQIHIEPVPAASVEQDLAASVIQPQVPVAQPSPDFEVPAAMSNPIASAVQEAASPGQDPAPVVQPAPAPPQPLVQPRPLVQPDPHHEAPGVAAPAAEAPERVEAETDQSQTIALSRIVPGQTTQRILNRPPKEEVQQTAEKVTSMPSTEEQIEQQDILQLEPVQSKGRFAKGDPTIVDGEDLDVPTFLRKKG
ncbi:MAG: cell division protein FtsZ [Verrucomicrobiales bacterium]|nr:cell division protein FtsZ [Verrucomicrobiales bacterium]